MSKTESFVGFTDTGQPLVLGESSCEHFRPGKNRLLNEKICWYCQYADFRKTIFVVLTTSICRCPQNQAAILSDGKNESLEQQGGGFH